MSIIKFQKNKKADSTSLLEMVHTGVVPSKEYVYTPTHVRETILVGKKKLDNF